MWKIFGEACQIHATSLLFSVDKPLVNSQINLHLVEYTHVSQELDLKRLILGSAFSNVDTAS